MHSQSGREGRKGSCGTHHQRAKVPVESSFERMFVARKKKPGFVSRHLESSLEGNLINEK